MKDDLVYQRTMICGATAYTQFWNCDIFAWAYPNHDNFGPTILIMNINTTDLLRWSISNSMILNFDHLNWTHKNKDLSVWLNWSSSPRNFAISTSQAIRSHSNLIIDSTHLPLRDKTSFKNCVRNYQICTVQIDRFVQNGKWRQMWTTVWTTVVATVIIRNLKLIWLDQYGSVC